MTPAKIPEGSPMTAQGLSAERVEDRPGVDGLVARLKLAHLLWANSANARYPKIGGHDLLRAAEAIEAAAAEVTRLRAIADGLAGALRVFASGTETFEEILWKDAASTDLITIRTQLGNYRAAQAALSTYDSDKGKSP